MVDLDFITDSSLTLTVDPDYRGEQIAMEVSIELQLYDTVFQTDVSAPNGSEEFTVEVLDCSPQTQDHLKMMETEFIIEPGALPQ